MLDNLKEYIKIFFNSRLLPITVVFVLLFSILVNRMFELQIVDRDSIIGSQQYHQRKRYQGDQRKYL